MFYSSPFAAKAQVTRKRLDETKENIDPHDRLNNHLGDQSSLASVVMEGTDELGSPVKGPDRVKVQLFSQKLMATGMTSGGNHGNMFHQELSPDILVEDNICGAKLQPDLDKRQSDLFPSTVNDHDPTTRGNLDWNGFVVDYSDNNSIEFDEDEFFRNTFLSSKSEN